MSEQRKSYLNGGNVLTREDVDRLSGSTRETMTSFTIPEGVTSIGEYTFSRCSSLTSITIPDSVTEIGSSAFAECKELQRFTVPDGIRKLPYGIFKFCSQLKCVSLPAALTIIDGCAFQGCAELTEIQLPSALEEIGYAAFFGCQKLREVILPVSICKIEDTAFLNCGKLEIKTANCRENLCVQAFLEAQERYKNMVILACPTYGRINNQPLPSGGKGMTAYCDCVEWEEERLALNSIVDVTVNYPFCCAIGDCFASTFVHRHGKFIQARLLDILSMDNSSARIRAEIIFIGDSLSYVTRLSQAELDELERQGTYHYNGPPGDAPNPTIMRESDHMVWLKNTFGGDVYYSHGIYTDVDGVDHLVMSWDLDFVKEYTYGDKVLGLHKFCPVQWENGLLIHHEQKIVMLCDDNVVDAVIPEGIETIGWYVFYNKPHLESITIPASVRYVYNAFESHNSRNLKKIILLRMPGQDRELETMLRKIFPAVEIVVKNADWNEMVHAQIKRKKPRSNPGEAYKPELPEYDNLLPRYMNPSPCSKKR